MTDDTTTLVLDGKEHWQAIIIAIVLAHAEAVVILQYFGGSSKLVLVAALFIVQAYVLELLLCWFHFGQWLPPMTVEEREEKHR